MEQGVASDAADYIEVHIYGPIMPKAFSAVRSRNISKSDIPILVQNGTKVGCARNRCSYLMVEAVISAKAGLVAFATANGFDVESIDDDNRIFASVNLLSRMLFMCDDVHSQQYVSREQARAQARLEWNGDRALAFHVVCS